jgi:hypothetical protein
MIDAINSNFHTFFTIPESACHLKNEIHHPTESCKIQHYQEQQKADVGETVYSNKFEGVNEKE